MILGMMMFLSGFLKKPTYNKGVALVVIPVFYLSLVIASVYLALSVALADFCSSPNQVVSGIISPGSDSVSSCETNQDPACIAAYYINCAPDAPFPFVSNDKNLFNEVNRICSYACNFGALSKCKLFLDKGGNRYDF
eukprot:m.39127 g.39127  ORF g.39127 m.39127 type:complete len:137 (+) comp9511_c0_seq2:781-1191(+)